jgi:hypothetical protein
MSGPHTPRRGLDDDVVSHGSLFGTFAPTARAILLTGWLLPGFSFGLWLSESQSPKLAFVKRSKAFPKLAKAA